jgi:hypothetical protein
MSPPDKPLDFSFYYFEQVLLLVLIHHYNIIRSATASCLLLLSLLAKEEGKLGLAIDVVAISAKDERELSCFFSQKQQGGTKKLDVSFLR